MIDKKLDGVSVSDCVIVSSFSHITTANTLELYFDNKKRCGAEGVRNVKMDRQLGKCWIYFEDPKCKNPTILNIKYSAKLKYRKADVYRLSISFVRKKSNFILT